MHIQYRHHDIMILIQAEIHWLYYYLFIGIILLDRYDILGNETLWYEFHLACALDSKKFIQNKHSALLQLLDHQKYVCVFFFVLRINSRNESLSNDI